MNEVALENLEVLENQEAKGHEVSPAVLVSKAKEVNLVLLVYLGRLVQRDQEDPEAKVAQQENVVFLVKLEHQVELDP